MGLSYGIAQECYRFFNAPYMFTVLRTRWVRGGSIIFAWFAIFNVLLGLWYGNGVFPLFHDAALNKKTVVYYFT